jgi:hypothetical protein
MKDRAIYTEQIKLEDSYNEIAFIDEMNTILIEIEKLSKDVFEQL